MRVDYGYIFNALIWSMVGFLCGFCFAKVQASSLLLDNQRKLGMSKMQWNKVASTLLVILALCTVAQGYVFYRHQGEIAECQERVNTELRSVGREERRDYFVTWRAILNSKSQDQSKKLFEDHLDRGDAREAKRDAAEKNRKRCG